MRHVLWLGLFLCGCAFAQPVTAQSVDRAGKIETAWSEWVQAGGTRGSTLAVFRMGELTLSRGHGVPSDTALPLASLSKAVTAACVAKLGLPMGKTQQGIRVGDLLTHRSGLGPDQTQGDAALIEAEPGQNRAVAMRALGRDRRSSARGSFNYNNENYAVLGMMIENLSGMRYEAACQKAVLDPAGVTTAQMTGIWAGHGAWGGWSMSAPDYARFIWQTFGPNAWLGAAPQDWPLAELNGGTRYGMGVFWRQLKDRTLFWHAGLLCWDGAGNGSYFASYGGEWLVVVLYQGCQKGMDRAAELDAALFDAAME